MTPKDTMSIPIKRKVGRPKGLSQKKRTELEDAVAEFEEFRETILPALQKDIKNKLGAKEILQKYQSIAAARKVMAIISSNEEVATRSAQQLLEHTIGKAKESVTHTFKYESLSDEELESKLQSLEREVKEIEPNEND